MPSIVAKSHGKPIRPSHTIERVTITSRTRSARASGRDPPPAANCGHVFEACAADGTTWKSSGRRPSRSAKRGDQGADRQQALMAWSVALRSCMILTPYVSDVIIREWDGTSKSATSLNRSSHNCTGTCESRFLPTPAPAQFGPRLGRPRVDTLNDSRHANMKELRLSAADGEWRAAFAVDTKRRAILLVDGDKSGGRQKRFYRQLIAKADDGLTPILPG